MDSVYTQRQTCLFCNKTEFQDLFESDKELPLGCFTVPSLDYPCHIVPYNAVHCKNCGTVQTKYIGNIELVYGNNFAGLFGTTRNKMNELFAKFVSKNRTTRHIVEIGAGNGEVCDMILEKNKSLSYTIVDPSYWGKDDGRTVVKKFFEEYTPDATANTIVMSHVFEHFYNPISILEKISSSSDIETIYLNWPNLEEFIKRGTYNVLNMEHIYYVENAFLEEVFARYGFKVKDVSYYNTFAVFYHFERISTIQNPMPFPKNKTTYEDTKTFFDRLLAFVKMANKEIEENKDLPVYIWPCSVHTSFCKMAGILENRITNILDNSPEKIGKYQYGFQVPCVAFNNVISSAEPKLVLLVGGIYAKEILEQAKQNPNNKLLLL